MRRLVSILAVLSVLIVATGPVHGDFLGDPYGLVADLDLQATITSTGATMTWVPYHGWNGAYGYVYTDVGGTVAGDISGENGGKEDTSPSASASTSNGEANGGVTVNTAGFDYSIHADATVQGLAIGDSGLAMGYAYAWPDWLQAAGSGSATITLDYTYTLDARAMIDDAEAYVFMNAFFADHDQDNYLTAQGDWSIGPPNDNGTTNVEYSRSIEAGDYVTVTDSVSWEIDISGTEPENWWSLWAYGEAGVEAEPVPVPGAVLLGILGLSVVGVKLRKFA